MPALTVWGYETPLGAVAGSVRLRRLERIKAMEVIDAVAVTWAPGAHRPRVSRVWPERGRLAEPSVLVELLRALRAATETEQRSGDATRFPDRLAEIGLSAGFQSSLTRQMAPGASALIVLSGAADLSVVVPVVQQRIISGEVTLLRADLEERGPAVLHELLGLATP